MGEGGLSSIQHAELDVISDIVLSGHDLGPGRRADRVGKTIGEADASRRQFVQVGGLAGFASVGRQGFIAHIIRHDQDDVGPGKGAQGPADKKGEE